jgi:ribosome-associated heat shock protein Hsp15
MADSASTSGCINRHKNDSAAQPVKVGDVLTIAFDASVRVLKVAALGTRRGPAPEARLLYEDLSPPPSVAAVAERRSGSGRPTKRDRRALEGFRGRDLANEDFPPEKS